EEFLKAVSPSVAVISVGKNNLHSYPSEEVITRLRNKRIRIYRTDRDSNILFYAFPDGRFQKR
ncbi:MAG: MBL fold metallo-hydrolase, partial [Candidatus Omnitrophota bacterium]